MGLLRFITGTARADAGSDSNLAAATALAIKVRFRGQVLLDLANGSFNQIGLVRVWDGTSAGKLEVSLREAGGSFTVWMEHVVATDSARSSGITRGTIVGSDFYTLYCHAQNGASIQGECELYDSAGTLLGTKTNVTYNWGALPTARGHLRIGAWASFISPTDRLDGIAIYSAPLAGAARYSEPLPGDTNIIGLWRMTNTSGATVTADVGTNMTMTGAEATDYAWETGGAWPGAGGGGPPANTHRLTIPMG
jgi:hypothetical protein